MNLANKITMTRIVLSVLLLIMLLFPWSEVGFEWPTYVMKGISDPINLKFLIAGGVFAIASITDFLDGYIARSRNMVTDFGKVTDAIADKLLVNGLLIILAYERSISVVIPVVIISRDIIVDSCKMIAGNKGHVVAASIAGKIKTICMMCGLTLVLFYNIPFEFINIPVDKILLILATLLSVISGVQYVSNLSVYFKDMK